MISLGSPPPHQALPPFLLHPLRPCPEKQQQAGEDGPAKSLPNSFFGIFSGFALI